MPPLTPEVVNVLTQVGAFLVFVGSAIGVGLWKSKQENAKKADEEVVQARLQETSSRQQVLDNFTALVHLYQERINELTSQLSTVAAELRAIKEGSAAKTIYLVMFVRRFLANNRDVELEEEDIEMLTDLGIDVLQLQPKRDVPK